MARFTIGSRTSVRRTAPFGLKPINDGVNAWVPKRAQGIVLHAS
jgi:hypothetical protein